MTDDQPDHQPLIQPEAAHRHRWIVGGLSLVLLLSFLFAYVGIRVTWQRGVEPGIAKLKAELDAVVLPSDINVKTIADNILRNHGQIHRISADPTVGQYLREFYEVYQLVAPLLSPAQQAILMCRDRPDMCRKIVSDIKKQTLQGVGIRTDG